MEIQVIDDKQAENKALDIKPELENEAQELKAFAESYLVVSQETYDEAMKKKTRCDEALTTLDTYYDPRIKQAHELHKGLLADKKKLATPWEGLKTLLSDKTTKWYLAEKEKAEEAKREAEEKARKEAEDAALISAQALKDAGMDNAAEAALSAPLIIPKISVAAPSKATGEIYKTYYSAQCDEAKKIELVKAVAEGKAPLWTLSFNEVELNKWARLTQGSESLPGVTVLKETKQGKGRG